MPGWGPRRVERFGMLRQRNLAELDGMDLGEPELTLEGLHPTLGVVTMRQLLATWVVHDHNPRGSCRARCRRITWRRSARGARSWASWIGSSPERCGILRIRNATVGA